MADAHSSALRRLAPQAMFCLLCVSLTVSLVWYILSSGDLRYHRWRLRRAAAPQSTLASSVERPRSHLLGPAAPAAAISSCTAVRCADFLRHSDAGGDWCVCADGPLLARPPCLAFAVGPDVAFDAEFARAHSCQVFNYNSPEHRPLAMGDGLWTLGRLNDTSASTSSSSSASSSSSISGGGSFRRLLGRLGASSHVVELLRIQLDASVSAARILNDAVTDGSLGNVKQLLLQAAPASRQLLEAALGRLAGTGFCPVWQQLWSLGATMEASPSSRRQSGGLRVSLVNSRFLAGPGAQPRHRNPPGSQIARPLEKLGLVEPLKDD